MGFDRRYYDRFYETKQTRVHGAAEIARLCTGVTAFLEWWNHPLGTVLDVGAGTGLWRDWFREHRQDPRNILSLDGSTLRPGMFGEKAGKEGEK